MKHTGYFITFEGGEGSGKTTQMNLLKKNLEKDGYEVLLTREPGGVPVAEKIRMVLLDPSVKDMDAMTEVMLYAAARREHLLQVILPALREGKVVVSDRYLDSSIVYQGIVKGVGLHQVYKINRTVIDDIFPVLTLYFDLDPEIGLKRIFDNDNREVNRFDRSPIAFHQKVREGYQALAEMFSGRYRTIDASLSIKETESLIHEVVQEKFEQSKKRKKLL